MWWNKSSLLALCVVLLAPCFEQCDSTTSKSKRDVLSSLIESGGCLDSLEFQNQVVQPDVKINGTGVMKSKDGSCIVGTSLVLPPDFCSPATYVTLYHGNPPSPQNFSDVIVGLLSPGGGITCIDYRITPGVAGVALKDVCVVMLIGSAGSELCARFPLVEPTRESEENSCSWGSIFGYVVGFLCIFTLIVIVCAIGSYFGYRKCLKKKDEVSKDDNLNFSTPQSQQGEGGVDGEQPGAVPNIFGPFQDELEAILCNPREGVLTIQSLRQVCRRASCQLAECPHHLFDMHIKLGDVEMVMNFETCSPKDGLAIPSLENKAKKIIIFKKDSCQSKYFQGFLFHHNTFIDDFDLSCLENQMRGEGVSLYKVETTSGTEPHCFRMFKDMLHMLIRQQTARLNDCHVSQVDVGKPVDAVTKDDPNTTATLLPNGIIKRNPSSRSMARSDGDEFCENTASQDDTLKFFTGEQDEYKTIDNEETEC